MFAALWAKLLLMTLQATGMATGPGLAFRTTTAKLATLMVLLAYSSCSTLVPPL